MYLNIANDYAGSKVYKNLYSQLDKLGCEQLIFQPIRSKKEVGKNEFKFKCKDSKIIQSDVLKKYHRIFFKLKIKSLYNSLLQQVDVKEISLCNATTLFSDGAIALKLKEKFGIPYVVSARHTDVVLFLKYRPDLIPLGVEILENATKIIFISSALKELFFSHRKISKYKKKLAEKVVVIPNGIDDFWLEHKNIENNVQQNKFLFIGKFDKRKNVVALINALEASKQEYPEIELGLVGGGGNNEEEIQKLIAENKSWIHFYGPVYDKNELLKICRSYKFFAMISHYETFGLVYVEALSQGLPVLFSKNQGIDGLFDIKIGAAAISNNINDIKEKISWMIDQNKDFEMDKIDFGRFSWKNIALEYEKIFNEARR